MEKCGFLKSIIPDDNVLIPVAMFLAGRHSAVGSASDCHEESEVLGSKLGPAAYFRVN